MERCHRWKGAPTELLTDNLRDLRESNLRIAARLDSVEAAVRDVTRDLGDFRADFASGMRGLCAEIASQMGGLRAGITSKLGATNPRVAGDLGRFRADVATQIGELQSQVATEIGGLRSEVVEKLGAINTNLERFQARTETSLRVLGWAITILIPLVISLVGAGFWITWRAAKVDSRMERVESRLGKEPGASPTARVP